MEIRKVNNLSIIDSKEQEALKQFRGRIPDILVNFNEYHRHDLSLLRWLRARDLDVNKAEEMLRKSLRWRAKENMDQILEWKCPLLIEQSFPIKVSGFDKDGCSLPIIPFGKWDVRKIASLGMKSDFARYVDSIFEQATKLAESRSKMDAMITQFVMIFDFEDFSLKQMASRETLECILEVLRRFEANQPETLKVAWVLNAPKIFELFFLLIKPIMSARTVSKVRVYGSNSDRWRPLLLENILPDQLPSQYGGSNTSCKDYKIIYGLDWFPIYEVFPESDFINVTVNAGAKHVITKFLSKSSKLSWNFYTTDYNIGFSFLYTSSNEFGQESEDSEVIFHTQRADSHLHLQKGEFVAENPGAYSLVFDNTFSRFRGKNLFFCIRVR